MAASNANVATAPFFRFANLSAQRGLRHAITTRWRPRKLNKQDDNGSADGEQDFASVDLLDCAEDAHPFPAFPDGKGDADFNLGYRAVGYDPQATATNWRYLTAALDIEAERIVAARQVHGGKVVRVGAADGGAGIRLQAWGSAAEWRDEQGPAKPPVAEADGLCTEEARVWLMNVYADCTPLLFHDPRQRAVAVAHAGWRGTVAQISAEVVAMMAREFATRPADLLCGIGPSAGPCCYQISEAVIEAVQAAFPHHADLLNFAGQPQGHAIFNLWAANHRVLEAAGVPPANIETAGICTIHRNDLFFSARSDSPTQAGRRFAAVIGLL
jgi:polyphenol oxidase